MIERSKTAGLIAAALFATFYNTQVCARSGAQIAAEWGLLGTWRSDCAKPVSQYDGELIYVVRNGQLFHNRNFGDDLVDSHQVSDVRLGPDGSINLKIKFTSISPPQTREMTTIKGADGRIRTITNRHVELNEYVIKDGKFLHNGKSSEWQTRCR